MHEYALSSGLSISFQRYRFPPSGQVQEVPRSCGALPISLTGPGEVRVPSPSGEAFWIGLVANGCGPGSLVRVSVSVAAGQWVDAVTGERGSSSSCGPGAVHAPPTFGVVGIALGDGTSWVFARDAPLDGAPSCQEVVVMVWHGEESAQTSVHVDLVDPEIYEAEGGESLAPLDESVSYGGWRLP